MRVILDSNILFSALISPNSPPNAIYEAWHKERFSLLTCEEQLEEIRIASRYTKLKQVLRPHQVGTLINNMKKDTVITNLPSGYEANDPHDSWMLALAAKTKADYLVTGDKRAGILSLHNVGHTKILTASEFLKKCLH